GVVLELTFALHQPVALLQELLASVSSPDSPSYGGYLSFDDVGEIVRDASATAAVIAWLDDSGAETTTTPHGEYVKARAPVVIFNALLNADFRAFHDDGRVHHRALEYSLPAHVAKRVSHVFGATHLPPAPRLRTAPKPLEATALALQGATPQLLNSYYNIKSNDGGGYGSQSLYESLGSNFSPSDLIKFQEHFGLPTGEVAVVLGGHDQSAVCDEMSGSDSCGEANLDVQYIMSIAQNVETWFWYAETNSSFTDWAFAVASRAGAPLVHSISYGTYENGTARSEIAAFDVEAMKLGLRGITVVVASGDDGSANYLARDHPDFCQGYWPSWPASSPYVVSVGATQGPEAGSAEIACSVRTGALITSGGGFSDVVDRPAYQDKAVRAFLDQPKFTFGPGFNAGGRGYPDVSMLGHDYPVIIGGTEMHFDGTSASAPVFAGVLALVNSDRLSKGQPSVGFANPVLYALAESHPGVFHDIVKGSNECPANVTACCANVGFYATPGWDAVTGLGSVNVAKLVAA
ncbi:peptidase S8/S53 domain-containing protein, partial [Pelagophyceae sp. CCMP2097]